MQDGRSLFKIRLILIYGILSITAHFATIAKPQRPINYDLAARTVHFELPFVGGVSIGLFET